MTPPRQLQRLGDPKPYFQAGQRVVCIDAQPNHLMPNCKPLVAGRIYCIRAIDLDGGWKFPWWGVHLEAVWIFHPDGRGEWAFRPDRFRAVTERATDITVFKKLATPALCASFLIREAEVNATAGSRTTG